MPTWPPPRTLSGALGRLGMPRRILQAPTATFASDSSRERAARCISRSFSVHTLLLLSSAVRRTQAGLASDDDPGHATIASLVKEPKPRGLVRDRKWYRLPPCRQGGAMRGPHRKTQIWIIGSRRRPEPGRWRFRRACARYFRPPAHAGTVRPRQVVHTQSAGTGSSAPSNNAARRPKGTARGG